MYVVKEKYRGTLFTINLVGSNYYTRLYTYLHYIGTTDPGGPLPEKSQSDVDTGKKPPVTPPPPPLDLCCMSGCQNCVMIQHAEELLKLYSDDTAARAAIEEIPDENLKTFLRIELNLK